MKKFFFVFILFLLACTIETISDVTKRLGFKKLKIIRHIENRRIFEGDIFSIVTTVENKKWLPISFLLLDEIIPEGIGFKNQVNSYWNGNNLCHISRYRIGWYERRIRIYELTADKRGTYILKDMQVTIGDIFGLSAETNKAENFVEVLVYPKVKDLAAYNFDSISFLGNNSVKRWILKDNLYIKGIREYCAEDRMKDIDWKSSLKMDKLMVKDFDTTSDSKIVIILSVQCGEPAWATVMEDCIENGIRISVSLASKAIIEGFPTGMWTNANIISMNGNLKSEVKPDLNSMRRIMELSARVGTEIRMELHEYFKDKSYRLDKDTVYVIVTPFLNEECIVEINKLKKVGFKFKIIDVSRNGDVPNISGIKKIAYRGEASV